ncbi:MAG: acylphosphatase [Emcibacter sp.]|nr:acylphosphatase [Emcibacter sp.]
MIPQGYKAIRLIISGRVQGVWYRGWTVEQANELGLDGWVRNRADGDVEALIVGEENLVDQMIKHCWNGPNSANVSHIEVQSAMGITPKGFKQKPTVDIEKRRT